MKVILGSTARLIRTYRRMKGSLEWNQEFHNLKINSWYTSNNKCTNQVEDVNVRKSWYLTKGLKRIWTFIEKITSVAFGGSIRKPLVLAPMCCNCFSGIPCATLATQLKEHSEAFTVWRLVVFRIVFCLDIRIIMRSLTWLFFTIYLPSFVKY